ncbi:sensor histidine kinase [Pseudothauera nasutitermitis]|uniref:sensor histidine kinase n=1 Tax=Pseudothauera nasutitermitis TaxID=2565930 RepID=UPI001454DE82|nr:sensor histidine kinase [Pseudothauera nasutitermitis]
MVTKIDWRRRSLPWFFFALCGWLAATTSHAQDERCEPYSLHADEGLERPADIGRRLLMLVDPGRQLEAKDVMALPSSAFTPVSSPISALTPDSTVWLRLCLQRAPQSPEHWILAVLPPYLSVVELARGTPAQHTVATQGAALPFSARELPYRGFAFSIDLPAEGSEMLHLRMESDWPAAADILVLQPGGMSRMISMEYLMYGLYLGMMLLAVVINIMFWTHLRDPVHLRYGLALACTAAFSLLVGGYGAQFLLPDSPGLILLLSNTTYAAAAAMFSLFMISAFRMRLYYRHLYRILCWLAAAFGLIALLTPFSRHFPSAEIADALALVLLPLLTFVSLHALFRHRSVRLYAIALLPLQLGVAITILRNTGLPIPIPLADHLPNIGAFIHLVLLNLLLARRAWRAQRGRMRAQDSALRTARRAETELEERVQARTRELNLSNARLQREITERMATEGRLSMALKSERDAQQMQRQFLSMISHEFRTPLAVIDAAAQGMADTLPADDENAPRAARIRRSVVRMIDVLENCLTEERLASAGARLQRTTEDLRTALWTRYGSGRSTPRIHLQLPAEPVPVHHDPQLLGIAVANLVDNALKYSPATEPVTVSLESGDGHAWITVSDRGDGVAEEDRPRIFEKYYRSPSALGRPGAGIGLHLCRELIRQHGGEIRLLPGEPGQGARFRLELPLADPEHH